MKQLPHEKFLYYADTDHVPYGMKTPEEVCRYSCEAAAFLIHQGADMLVIACNTATSMAINVLREKYSLPIVGMEPAIRPAAIGYPGQKILICATPLTIYGQKLHNLVETYIQPENAVLAALPSLVTWAEQGIYDYTVVLPYLRKTIPADTYAAVVLGCTHFALFRDSFRKLLGRDAACIDGTAGTVRRVVSLLPKVDKHTSQPCVRYFVSGREIQEHIAAKIIGNVHNRLEELEERE